MNRSKTVTKFKDYSLEVLDNFVEKHQYVIFFTPLTDIVLYYVGILFLILLLMFTNIYSWLIFLGIVISWCRIGNLCFTYETYMASEPKGNFINPHTFTTPFESLIWLFGGIFLSIAHILLRRQLLGLNEDGNLTLKR